MRERDAHLTEQQGVRHRRSPLQEREDVWKGPRKWVAVFDECAVFSR